MKRKTGYVLVLCLLVGILLQIPYGGSKAEAAARRTVYFGSYYQEPIMNDALRKVIYEGKWNNDETVCRGKRICSRNGYYFMEAPIEWIVLNENGGVLTLLAKSVLDYRAFGNAFWVDSEIRSWLNNEFLKKAFTPAEQNAIVMTPATSWYHTYQEAYIEHKKGKMIQTTDKVYLLSDEELESVCVGAENDNMDIKAAHASRLVSFEEKMCSWWLRSRASWNYGSLQNSYVSYEGPGNIKHWYGTWKEGIRPVIRVKAEAVASISKKPTVHFPEYCDIRFDRNGAPRGVMNSIKNYELGTSRKLPKNQFKWSGFKFLSWNTRPDGKGVTFKNAANLSKMKAAEGETITLYAQWKGFGFLTNMVTLKEKITISKNTSGGKAAYSSSDKSIFEVNKNTGVITPKKNGMATLTMKVKGTSVKQTVVVNHDSSWKLYHIKEKLEGLAQDKENKKDTMCPQGICITRNYILISAYNSDELYSKNQKVKNSLIYVMGLDGSYKGCFDIGTTSHVGGMAYDPEHQLVFVSNGKKIQYFSEWSIESYLRNKKIDKVNRITNMKGSTQISTLTWHKNQLWVVYCVQDKKIHQSKVLAIDYKVTRNSSGNISVKAQKENAGSINNINYVNGIVFVSDNSDTMLLTRSTGRNAGSEIYSVTINKDIVKKQCPTVKLRMKIPSMAEGMAVKNGKLLTLFESSSDLFSKPYKKGTAEKNPMDYLTVFNISKWK